MSVNRRVTHNINSIISVYIFAFYVLLRGFIGYRFSFPRQCTFHSEQLLDIIFKAASCGYYWTAKQSISGIVYQGQGKILA